jgi:hypothetical protein
MIASQRLIAGSNLPQEVPEISPEFMTALPTVSTETFPFLKDGA